jgi:hypothetical protein
LSPVRGSIKSRGIMVSPASAYKRRAGTKVPARALSLNENADIRSRLNPPRFGRAGPMHGSRNAPSTAAS